MLCLLPFGDICFTHTRQHARRPRRARENRLLIYFLSSLLFLQTRLRFSTSGVFFPATPRSRKSPSYQYFLSSLLFLQTWQKSSTNGVYFRPRRTPDNCPVIYFLSSPYSYKRGGGFLVHDKDVTSL